MSYDLAWRRAHPGHLVYLVDISGSTARKIGDQPLINIILGAMGKLFERLASECEAGDKVRDYFSVTVIGYNTDLITLHKSKDSMEFTDFYYAREGEGELFNTTKEAKPQWQTYMASAFDAAAKDIREWIDRQSAVGKPIPAPIVINITDGVPEEAGITLEQARDKALEAAKKLRSIATPDGNVLLLNIHFSPDNNASTVILPSTAPTDHASRFLFDASSILPAKAVEKAKKLWPQASINSNSHFMISNEKNPRQLFEFIDFGSSVSLDGGMETPKPN